MPHCSVEGDFSSCFRSLTFTEGGRYLNLKCERSPAMEWNQEQFFKRESEKTRGVCKGFSFGSRRRMLDRLNQVSVGAEMPDFVTLTLPDDCFKDSCSEFAAVAKRFLDVLLKRLHRACPSASGFWRIEWKARKSGCYIGKLFPHFHLLIWGLPQRLAGVHYSGRECFESFVFVVDCQQSLSLVFEQVGKAHVFEGYSQAEKFGWRVARHR